MGSGKLTRTGSELIQGWVITIQGRYEFIWMVSKPVQDQYRVGIDTEPIRNWYRGIINSVGLSQNYFGSEQS